MVAFANAEGGTVVVGLHNGKVEGVANLDARINGYQQAPLDFTVPPVRAKFHQVPCLNDRGGTDSLLVVRVDPSERVHETQDGECYLRVGDESRRLNFSQRQELEFDRGQSQYDGAAVTDADLFQLDDTLIEYYRKRAGVTGNRAALFNARSLLTQRGELTVAGYLLFAPYPQQRLPQAYIRVLRFLTTQRGTGAQQGLEEGSDFRIEGPIPTAVEQATHQIEALVPRRRTLGESGLFESRSTIPRDAWLEGLVNAVIHRSYSLSGDHIRVEIYPDRNEIESPGTGRGHQANLRRDAPRWTDGSCLQAGPRKRPAESAGSTETGSADGRAAAAGIAASLGTATRRRSRPKYRRYCGGPRPQPTRNLDPTPSSRGRRTSPLVGHVDQGP